MFKLARKIKFYLAAHKLNPLMHNVPKWWHFKNLAAFSQISQENTCCSLLLIKLQAWRLLHRCFSEKFPKFLRTPFFPENFRWLLLCSSPDPNFAWNLSELIRIHSVQVFNSLNLRWFEWENPTTNVVGNFMTFGYWIFNVLINKVLLVPDNNGR